MKDESYGDERDSFEEKKLDPPHATSSYDEVFHRRRLAESSPHKHHYVHFSRSGGSEEQPQQQSPHKSQRSVQFNSETPISRHQSHRHNFTIERPVSATRTKSWTDQRAPEPFSSPAPTRRKKKYGYGDLFGTTSGSNAIEDRINYRHSYHSSNKAKVAFSGNNFDRRRSSDAYGITTTKIQRRNTQPPSFSELDFPVLSPQKSQVVDANSKEDERTSSWSSIVGVQQGEGNHTRANNDVQLSIGAIPSLPFTDSIFSKTIDESKLLDVPETVLLDVADDIDTANWEEDGNYRRQRSYSVQYHAQEKQMHQQRFSFSHVKADKVPPAQSSISALQNDIGSLLTRSNQMEDAIERYKLSIESATVALDGLTNNNVPAKVGQNKFDIPSPVDQCPVKVSEGLSWFRSKLLRGDVAAVEPVPQPKESQNDVAMPPPPFQPAGFGGCAPSSPRRFRSASFCAVDFQPTITRSCDEPPSTPLLQTHSFRKAFTQHISPKRHIAPLDDIVQDIHHHQKLDCPEDVYSCNGRTPLGLEYICDPLPILGRSLRKLTVGQDERSANIIIETAALVTAKLNLAALEYRLAGGGVSEKLQQVLETLKNCISSFDNEDGDESALQSNNFFVTLKAIAHVNTGTCLYRLNKVREAMANFELAQSAIAQYSHDLENELDENAYHSHDDDRFPPFEYILLVIRVNSARAMLRLKKDEEAKKLCDQIAEDNKPHRKNSSSRRLSAALPSRMYGFRRSSSFSATSSALEASTAAYDHEVDRRSKWLCSVAEHFLVGLIYEERGDANDHKEAWHHYNRLLSLARTKLDHRHPYICSLLERRGAVLFSQRKLQCSMLSYTACLHVLEHQQSNGSNVFNQADLARVLYAVARVLHDKEEYHDALGMYNRALSCQREVSINSTRPSLDVITTLCNISRVHHLSGDLDAALSANKEVLELATLLVGGKLDHPFLIHRLKVEGNILIEAGRLEDAMRAFVEAARRCGEDGRDQMMTAMMGTCGQNRSSNSQEDADAGDSSVLSIRSAATLAHMNCFHPGAAAA